MTKGKTSCWLVYLRLINNHYSHTGSLSGLMVSALIFGSSSSGSNSGRGHCVLWQDMLYSDRASLNPGVPRLLVTHATETWICSGLMGHLAHMQSLLYSLKLHAKGIDCESFLHALHAFDD